MKKEQYARAFAILRIDCYFADDSLDIGGIASQFALHAKVKEVVSDEQTAKEEVQRLNELSRKKRIDLLTFEEGDLLLGDSGRYFYQPTLLRFGKDDQYETHPGIKDRAEDTDV